MGQDSLDGIIRQRPSKYIRYSAEAAARKRTQYAPHPSVAAKRVSSKPQKLAVNTHRRRAGHSRLGFKLAGAFATLMLAAGAVSYGAMHHARFQQLKEAALPSVHAAELPNPVTSEPAVDIAHDMNAVISTQSGLTASATLIDLGTGKTYAAGTPQKFEAASTAKLLTVFAYIHRVELGKATLTQNVGGMTAQENIHRMIVYSDNDAWARMNAYLTMPGQQTYANSLGLTAQFKAYDIEFTSADMAKLLQMLYTGQLMNDQHRAMVYDYMAHTTVKNLVQAVLPADTLVYHKYGQIDGVLHDASIVQYQGHHFVLVVYTSNPDGTTHKSAAQVSLIHAVTTAAFQDITK